MAENTADNNAKVLTTKYEGYDIAINDVSWQFSADVDGETFRSDSMNELKSQIDRHVTQKRKAAKRSFEPIAMVDEELQLFQITGIHATNLNKITKPRREWQVSGKDEYVDNPTVHGKLAEIRQLKVRIGEIEKAILPYRLIAPPAQRLGYEEYLDKFLAEVDRAKKGEPHSEGWTGKLRL